MFELDLIYTLTFAPYFEQAGVIGAILVAAAIRNRMRWPSCAREGVF